MTTQSASVKLSVVPDAQTQKEIENTIDAPRRLSEAIEDFKRKRAEAEGELAQSLNKDLATAPLNADSAIEKHKAWKAKDETGSDQAIGSQEQTIVNYLARPLPGVSTIKKRGKVTVLTVTRFLPSGERPFWIR